MMSERFYAELPVLERFAEVADPSRYAALPDGWYVVVADVRGSTQAIETGRYKEVNMVGVSVITAVVNAVKPLAIPYVFGGDGASLCVPGARLEPVRRALEATQRVAQTAYGLHLRVSVVPIDAIRTSGRDVLVARHRASRHCVQAAFAGGGVEWVEQQLKETSTDGEGVAGAAISESSADLSGLECRWRSIPSPHGETVALLVKAVHPAAEQRATVYREVMATIDAVYGDEQRCRPVAADGLRLAWDARSLGVEVRARTAGRSRIARSMYWAGLVLEMVFGAVVMGCGAVVGGVAWGAYRRQVVDNTDFRKFDDMLREVLSGTTGQRDELARYLEGRYQQAELVYGIHVSPAALMTCMILDRRGEHVHFVDGSNGGYAEAAKQLKHRLRTLSKRL